MNIYTAGDRTPYTYLIGWSTQNKWYYGVRYAKECHPSDLWISYFTSSKYVKKFQEEFGEPDIIQVRKTFTDSLKAKLWEERVLTKIKTTNPDDWLNIRFDSFRGIIITEEMRTKMSVKKKGRNPWGHYDDPNLIVKKILETKKKNGTDKMSDEQKELLRQHQLKNCYARGTKYYNDGSKNYRLSPTDPLVQTLIKGKLTKDGEWYTDGVNCKIISNNEAPPDGWYRGRSNTNSTKNRRWFTNGETNLYLVVGEPVPEGFHPGATQKRIKHP